MMLDIGTVMWKEWRSLLRGQGSRLRAAMTLLVPVAWFGFGLPWQAGLEYVHRVDSFFAALAIPLVVGILLAPDSFAGERERNTLPTLLASRLPDRAILFGKALFITILAWGITVAVLAVGLITVNTLHWSGKLMFFPPQIGIGCLGLSLIASTLPVGAGILISLSSPTAQVAQQSLTAALFLPPTILGPIMLVLARSRPGWLPRELLATLGFARSLSIVIGLLAVLDVLLFVLAMRRFERSRLASI